MGHPSKSERRIGVYVTLLGKCDKHGLGDLGAISLRQWTRASSTSSSMLDLGGGASFGQTSYVFRPTVTGDEIGVERS
jgi:hypothetical protein